MIRFPDIPPSRLEAKADRTPTVIPDGDTFLVPEDTQMLYAAPIQFEGDGVVQVDGALIEVA